MKGLTVTTRPMPRLTGPPAPQARGQLTHNLRSLALLLATAVALLACNAARAQYANFSDTNQWTLYTVGSGVTVQPSADGTSIQFTCATNASSGAQAYYQSTLALSGNWTVEFNYSLNTWPANNGVGLGAEILPFVSIGRQSGNDYTPGENYAFANGPATAVPTTDMSGRMQLSLQGSTLTASYWNAASNAWVVVGQAQGFSGPDGPWPSQGPFYLQIANDLVPNSGGGQVVVDTISDLSIVVAPCTPHTAAATATLDHGFVVAATITDAGCGYTNTPAVIIQGGGGSGATATAVVSNGVVTGITITDAGIGYSSLPTVYISAPLPPAVSLKKAVKPTFASLSPPFTYQLQVSPDLVTWTNQGAAFTATNSTMDYPLYFDVDDWNALFFRLQLAK